MQQQVSHRRPAVLAGKESTAAAATTATPTAAPAADLGAEARRIEQMARSSWIADGSWVNLQHNICIKQNVQTLDGTHTPNQTPTTEASWHFAPPSSAKTYRPNLPPTSQPTIQFTTLNKQQCSGIYGNPPHLTLAGAWSSYCADFWGQPWQAAAGRPEHPTALDWGGSARCYCR